MHATTLPDSLLHLWPHLTCKLFFSRNSPRRCKVRQQPLPMQRWDHPVGRHSQHEEQSENSGRSLERFKRLWADPLYSVMFCLLYTPLHFTWTCLVSRFTFFLLQVRSAIRAVTMARAGLLVLKTARLVSNKDYGDFTDGIKEVFSVQQLINSVLNEAPFYECWVA